MISVMTDLLILKDSDLNPERNRDILNGLNAERQLSVVDFSYKCIKAIEKHGICIYRGIYFSSQIIKVRY